MPGSADRLRSHDVPLSDGTVLAVQESGRPDGPPLLLLPGQANSHDWWTDLRDGFEEFRVVTFDYRGTGATRADDRDDTWSTGLFADDARAVLAALDVERAHVYGTSMGGRVAQMLAVQAPEVVDRLVLACTSPGGAVAKERGPDVRRMLTTPDLAERARVLLDLFYTPACAERRLRSHLLGDPSMTSRAQMRHLRVSARHDAADRLAEITAPTLVLHGTEDRMTPAANATTIAQRIPGSRLVLTRGGRHGFFDEFSATVTPGVVDFLGGRDR